mgnify:CR=1 FL=1
MSWAATAFRVCAWRYAWLRCLWAAVGPGWDTPGDESVPVWRAPGTAVGAQWAARGLRGLVAVPVGGGGAWPGFEIDHSERSSCVAISRAGRRPQAQPAGSSGQASRRPEVWWRRCRAGARWRRCRAKLVARTVSGRAGLALRGSVVARLPSGSEVGRIQRPEASKSKRAIEE